MWLKIQLLRDEAASLKYVMDTCVQEVKQIEQWLQMYRRLSDPQYEYDAERDAIVEELVGSPAGKKVQIAIDETDGQAFAGPSDVSKQPEPALLQPEQVHAFAEASRYANPIKVDRSLNPVGVPLVQTPD